MPTAQMKQESRQKNETRERRLFDLTAVSELIGVHYNTGVKMNQTGLLPEPIRISPRIVRWDSRELDQWIEAGCPSRERWEALKAATKKQTQARVGRER